MNVAIDSLVHRLAEERKNKNKKWICLYFPEEDFPEEALQAFMEACRQAHLPFEACWWAAAEYGREIDSLSPILLVMRENKEHSLAEMGLIHTDSPGNKPEYASICVRCEDFRQVHNNWSTTSIDVPPITNERDAEYIQYKFSQF